MTDVIRIDPAAPEPERIAAAAARLRRGQLVAFPTETVYGLGVHALDRDAVGRLFAAKGRPASDPLIVHVAATRDAEPLVRDMPGDARRLADRFWPGPLTLVLTRAACVPDAVTAGLDTVALRVPAHPVAHALIVAAGVPVAAPSANLFSRPSPTLAAHVLEDLDGRVDLVLDGGASTVGVESTVVDLTCEPPVVLRPGAVTLQQLRTIVPQVEERLVSSGGPMRSPGLLDKHYSPRAPLTLYRGEQDGALRKMLADAAGLTRAVGTGVGLLLFTDDRVRLPAGHPFVVEEMGPRTQLALVASRLYAALRSLDARGVHTILARDVPADEGIGAALHDRLMRAAAGRIEDA